MTPRRHIVAVAATIALAVHPAAALAQNGAGDEQYQDPFSGSSQPAKKPKRKPQASPQTQQQPAPSQQPVQSQATPAQSTPTQGAAAAPAQSPSELPRTGFDFVAVALVGVALVLAGLVLRRRAAHGRD